MSKQMSKTCVNTQVNRTGQSKRGAGVLDRANELDWDNLPEAGWLERAGEAGWTKRAGEAWAIRSKEVGQASEVGWAE